MNPEKESPRSTGVGGAGLGQDIERAHPTTTGKPVKWRRILAELYAGRSFNRFEAEHIGEHVLHTTVATLQSKGVTILRHNESVRGFLGCETTVRRYQIDRQPDNMERARVLLGDSASSQDANIAPASRDPAVDVGEHFQGLDRARGRP